MYSSKGAPQEVLQSFKVYPEAKLLPADLFEQEEIREQELKKLAKVILVSVKYMHGCMT